MSSIKNNKPVSSPSSCAHFHHGGGHTFQSGRAGANTIQQLEPQVPLPLQQQARFTHLEKLTLVDHPAEGMLLNLTGKPLYLYFTSQSVVTRAGLEAPMICDLTLSCSDPMGWTAEQKGLGSTLNEKSSGGFGVYLIRISARYCVLHESAILGILDGLAHFEGSSLCAVHAAFTCDVHAHLTHAWKEVTGSLPRADSYSVRGSACCT
mgnify:CR=1 FL=1